LIPVTDKPFESDDGIAEIAVSAQVTINWLSLKKQSLPKVISPVQGRPILSTVQPMSAVKVVPKSGGCAVILDNIEALQHVVKSQAFLNIALRHRVSSSSKFDLK
jgi:hypothetical protein